MKIPYIGEADAPNPGRTFAPLDSTTFDRVGRANERVGAAVENLGEMGASLATRMKSAIDQGALAKAETAAETHYQAFVDSLKDGTNPENNDPATYQKRWQEQHQVLSQQISEDSGIKALGARSRIQFQTDMDKFKLMTNQSVGHLATQKALENGVGDIKVNYAAKLVVGDTQGAEDTVKKGMATGLLNPEEGKMMIYQIPIKNEYNQAQALGQQDPILAEKALQNESNYPHLVGSNRTQLRLTIHREAQIKLQENLREVLNQVDENPNDLGTQEMVNDMAARGQITPQAHERILARVAGLNLKEDRATASVAAMQAHDHDFTVDADPEGTAKQMKDAIAGLPATLRKPVWEQIDNRLAAANKAGVKAESPVEKDIFDRMKEDRHENGTFIPQVKGTVPGKSHWFGPNEPDTTEYKHVRGGLKALQAEDKFSDEDIQALFGKGVTRKQVLDAEEMHYSQVTGKMRDWFAAHVEDAKKPGFEEQAEAYRQKLTQPFVVAALQRSVTPAAKPAAVAAPATNQEMLDWLKANPNDPRAAGIKKKAGL